jgi:hypothetical protein
MKVFVEGVGLRGPGLPGWVESRAALAGGAPYRPVPTEVPPSLLLPPNERRRAVQAVKLTLALGAEAFAAAGRDAAVTATIFTSSGGDGETIHEILEVLASSDRALSPTRFHNSVHNAPAGYWSIATRSQAPSTSLCCRDGSFAAGLLEASAQAIAEKRVAALIAYDLRYPEPLNAVRPIGALFGTALILAPAPTPGTFARLDIELGRCAGGASIMASATLEELRRSTPAARCLPLLAALARGAAERVIIEYLPDLDLAIAVEPLAAAPGAARRRVAEA